MKVLKGVELNLINSSNSFVMDDYSPEIHIIDSLMKTAKGREFSNLSNQVIGCAIEVHRTLGPGLLESAYLNCLAHELNINQIEFKTEYPLSVQYKGIHLDCGYKLDLLVENQIILELKSVDQLKSIHEAQLLTYMKLMNIKQGFLINFNVTLLKQGLRSFVL